MNERVSAGWITALPSMASRAAWTSSSSVTSFSRYPEMPACIALATAPADSSTVNRITFVSGRSARMALAACSPSIPGIWTSMKMRSASASLAAATASSPLPASATISMSEAAARAERSPSRVTGWSSTIMTRIAGPSKRVVRS